MKSTIRALSVALLLTTITPAHGMFRGGFMAAKTAVNRFLTQPRNIDRLAPSYWRKMTPAQGSFTTLKTGWFNRPWLRRGALVGAATVPAYVTASVMNDKLKEERTDKFVQKSALMATFNKFQEKSKEELWAKRAELEITQEKLASTRDSFGAVVAMFNPHNISRLEKSDFRPNVRLKAQGSIECTTPECQQAIQDYAKHGKTWSKCVMREKNQGPFDIEGQDCIDIRHILDKEIRNRAKFESPFIHDVLNKTWPRDWNYLHEAMRNGRYTLENLDITVKPTANPAKATFALDTTVTLPRYNELCESVGKPIMREFITNPQQFSQCIKDNRTYKYNPVCSDAAKRLFEGSSGLEGVTFDKVDVDVTFEKPKTA